MADRHEWFLNQIFRHRMDLQRYLQRFTSGAEDIDDLIQETYLRVYSLPDYENVDSPKTYLFTTARARAFSIYSFGISIGSAIGIVAGGYLATLMSWRMAFIAVGMPGLIVAPLHKLTVRESPRGALY